ncbi:MAG TPA: response regulator [Sphingomicrobium sp.]
MVDRVPVLICDDDPLLLELLAHRLQTRGYDVHTAKDGGQAMNLLEAISPAAVVLDVMMPVVNGYEVLRRIREDERFHSIPVIMLTARKQERDIVGALDLGASDYLSKPFIPEELVARLNRLTGKSR